MPTEVRLGDMKPSPYNPRTIDPEARRRLKESLASGGLVETLVWNRRTGNLVGGHQRRDLLLELAEKDAKKTGGDPLDVTYTVAAVDVDDAEERRLNVLLNNPNAQGRYDAEGLLAVFEGGGFSAEAAGFAEVEVDELLASAGIDTAFTDSMFQGEDPAAGDAATIAAMMDAGDEERKAERKAARKQTVAGVTMDRDEPEAIRETRSVYSRRAADMNEADYTLTVVFASDAEKAAFCNVVGVPAARFMVAGERIVRAVCEPGATDQLAALFAPPDADGGEG